MKKTLLASSIAAIAMSSALNVQAENFDDLVKKSSVNFDFRFRTESVDADNGKDATIGNTLKSRLTFKSGEYAGVSVFIEGDNVFQVTDGFHDGGENGTSGTEKNTILDQETTQFNQAYVQFVGADSTIKAGNQRILLDNQRHVGGVAWRQDEATFDAVSISNSSIEGATIFAAFANNRNTITNDNTEETISLLNVKYALDKDLSASVFYYGIQDLGLPDSGTDLDTFGIRSMGAINDISYEAELATQNKTTSAGGDFTTLYYHLNAGTKLGSVKTTLGYEVFGSDSGSAAFITPLGTNHKFFGWSDVFLTGAGNTGIEDVYLAAVTNVSGVKLVGQFHNFSSSEGSTDLGTELGFIAAKDFGNYGANIKLAQYNAGDEGIDVTKIWLTATAKF